MSRLKTIGIAVLFIVLFSSLVHARISVDVVAISDQIQIGETASFDVIIENLGPGNEDLRFQFVENPSWSIITDPIFHQASLKLAAGEKKTTRIHLTPDASIESSRKYDYNFRLVSNLNKAEQMVTLTLFVRSRDRLQDYVPIVNIDADLNFDLDPRNPAQLSLLIENFNRLNISSIIVEVSSLVDPSNDRTFDIPLAGLEKKSIEIDLDYSPLLRPVKEVITVRWSVPARNATFSPKVKSMQILPYAEVQREIAARESFLKTVTTITLFNDGNVDTVEEVRLRTSLFKSIFTSEQPKARVEKQAGYRYLVWAPSLRPQETGTVQVTVNYRPLFFILAGLLIASALYLMFRSPLVARKEAVKLHHGDELSKVKIQLMVKNRTAKVIENISVVDRIPHIAILEKDFPVGTIQPSKVIKNERKGTLLKWTIPSLEAFEERIITYSIGSKLKIIGGLRLSPAVLKYKNRMNSFSRVYSNRATAR